MKLNKPAAYLITGALTVVLSSCIVVPIQPSTKQIVGDSAVLEDKNHSMMTINEYALDIKTRPGKPFMIP